MLDVILNDLDSEKWCRKLNWKIGSYNYIINNIDICLRYVWCGVLLWLENGGV